MLRYAGLASRCLGTDQLGRGLATFEYWMVACTAEWSLHLDIDPARRMASRSTSVGAICSTSRSLGAEPFVVRAGET